MSTADATAIQPPEVRPTRRLRQAASWTFHQGARLIEQLPPDVFTRRTQAAVDFLLCAVAVFLACQLRFDFGVTIWMQPIMWAWVLILPFLRVASIWGLRGYDGIWRYFNMRDAVRLAYICIPTTVVLLVLRLWFYDKHWVAGVPLSVIFVEVILFVIMASGMRALRRFTFESARRAGVRRMRALVVGNDHTIFAALWQLYAFPNVDIVGFLTPERALHGHRIAGWPVLGPPEVLAKLLAMNRIDLVLVADANMGCIGATVETATELGASRDLAS